MWRVWIRCLIVAFGIFFFLSVIAIDLDMRTAVEACAREPEACTDNRLIGACSELFGVYTWPAQNQAYKYKSYIALAACYRSTDAFSLWSSAIHRATTWMAFCVFLGVITAGAVLLGDFVKRILNTYEGKVHVTRSTCSLREIVSSENLA